MEEHPSFKKLQTAVERRRLAQTTAKAYTDSIHNLVEKLNLKDPENALQVIRQKEDPEEYLNEVVDTLRQTMSDTMVNFAFKAVRYWLRVNSLVIDWDSVIIPTGEIVVEDRIPTTEELNRLLTIANIRDQSITLVASSSGLRLNTLLTLSVGDVTFDFPDVARIMVKRVYRMAGKEYRTGRKISKKRKFFVTYITPEARKALQAYLKWRAEGGEVLTPESPLFTNMDKAKRGRFLGKHAFDVQWRKLLKRAHLDKKANGSPWNILHFHVLKKYAETKMIDASLNRTYLEFFLGHKGGYLEANYFRGEEEKCLQEYRKAIPNLVTQPKTDLAEIQRRQEILEKIQMKILSGEDLDAEDKVNVQRYRIRLMKKAPKREKREEPQAAGAAIDNSVLEEFEQIHEADLLAHLKAGWQIVHRLTNGEVIVKR